MYETLEDFYLAEAWSTSGLAASHARPADRRLRPDRTDGAIAVGGRLVNELELDLRHCHFWGMDDGCSTARSARGFPLSFARTDRELLFNRIRPELPMPEANIHFPKADARSTLRRGDRPNAW